MAVKVTSIGELDGTEVRQAQLDAASGVSLEIIGYGARVRDWRVPVGGRPRPVVLGYQNWRDYLTDPNYFGAIAGRVANRIGNSAFELDGRSYRLAANEGAHHLHGGPGGLSKRVWDIEPDSAGNAVRLSCSSPDGDMGYPGAAEIAVTYGLDTNRVTIDFTARVTARTPINLVQHHYFNLMGHGAVNNHRLRIAASRFTLTDAELIPTGEVLPVKGTPNDFRAARTLAEPGGEAPDYDLNFALDAAPGGREPAAVLEAPDGALTLSLWTDQPGLQVYNSAHLTAVTGGLEGAAYERHGGICLEDQGFPDAVNHPGFPSVICSPERPYTHRCAIEIV